MTRIVGGSAGGRRLAVPGGRDVRPTSDRAREGLFDTLGTLLDLAGVRVLDLYAGTGAVGLEAVSRGAAHALLVEADPRVAAAARANAAALGLADRVQVARDRVERALGSPPAEPYQLAFADPPYLLPDADVERMLAALAPARPAAGWLASGAVVVVERSSRGSGPAWPATLEPIRPRRYGEGTLWYGRRI
jgi:16S rRNA (guanine966-N2)-methyltransferase